MTTELVVLDGEALLPDGRVLLGVHDPRLCEGRPCTVHRPTDHPMRTWPLTWRGDRNPGLFERICVHGRGHPDPDQREFWALAGMGWMGVHGCDGCCRA